jgi:hypothetical protein
VQLSVGRALADAVWPAVWPAAAMAVFVLATRDFVPANLVAVAVEMALGAGVYAVVFVFFGISADQRRLYVSKTIELLQRRDTAPAVAEGA